MKIWTRNRRFRYIDIEVSIDVTQLQRLGHKVCYLERTVSESDITQPYDIICLFLLVGLSRALSASRSY